MSSTAQTVKLAQVGGPEVLELIAEPLEPPAADQIQLIHDAIGVNYIDVYHRTGTYPLPLPSGIGVEGVGVVRAIGDGLKGFAPGDRVAYVGGPPGGYATARNVPAARALKLPDGIDSVTAASLIFKGLTVEYLIRRCYEVKPSECVLVHAAAGGVGLIAGQWLKHLGATVIGTVSTEAKARLALANGYDHAIVRTTANFVERVREITGGSGVSVVYDSIGKDTFAGSLDCLRPRGVLASFGTASGPVPPFDVGQLGAKGSLFVTRPSIAHYTAKREELEAAAASLFNVVLAGHIQTGEVRSYRLADAAQAHRDLESGATAGSLILLP